MENINKTGLVLEGGGMRGIYTAGVLDVFLEAKIHFDGVIGVSAGAIHGCSFVSGQKERSIRYYRKYCRDKRFMSYRNFIRTGNLVDTQFCYYELPERLAPYDYQAFDDRTSDFYVTCSNLETGKAEYIKITDMKKEIDAVRASASLPYVSQIVDFQGKKLLDGGCTDSIPVKAFQKMGFEKNVVVLTREREYEKGPEKSWMAKIFYRSYPQFVKAVRRRHLVYNETLKDIRRMEEEGSAFVIAPEAPLAIGRMSHDPEEILAVYKLGRRDGKRRMKELKAWLGE